MRVLLGDNDDDPNLTEDDIKDLEAKNADGSTTPKHRITLMPDHLLAYPELWLEVYVAGSKHEETQFAQMFVRARCKRAASPEEADVVVFTGGPDVEPIFYGEIAHRSTSVSQHRDTEDIELYRFCVDKGIPMLGVCRGAQFLHVMNGGKLFQDLDGHYGDHAIVDLKTKEIIKEVSSVHHQACRPNPLGRMHILATANKSRYRVRDVNELGHKKEVGSNADIEAFFYPDTCCLGVQGHPEYRGYNAYAIWCLKQIEECFILNNDVDWCKTTGKRRLSPAVLAMRNEVLVPDPPPPDKPKRVRKPRVNNPIIDGPAPSKGA